MGTVSTARTARRLAGEHPAWLLLRSTDAAAAVALLGRHLARGTRHLSEADLVARLEDEIAELRRQGFDLAPSARSQVAEWLRDGILVRRPCVTPDGPHAPGQPEQIEQIEQIELSDGGLAAVAFVARLARPHPVATPARLAIVLGALRDLADDAEPDPETRLAALRARRARLDAEIDAVRHGTVTPLAPGDAAERAREILALAADVPADLLRVRADLTSADAGLRRELTASGPTRDAFVDDVFRGVDHLGDTPAGRGLTAFGDLLDDGEHDAVAHVTRLLQAPGATAELTSGEVAALRRLVADLRAATDEATGTMTALRRALQRAARSGDLPLERALAGLLREAEAAALELADDVPPHTPTSLVLKLPAVAPVSPSGVVPHDPADDRPAPLVRPRPAAPAGSGAPVDLAALRALARAAEIDDDELRGYVNDVVARRGAATIGEVLRVHPATQGLASIIGLLALAERHARRTGEAEDVAWPGPDGTFRHARLPRHRFEEPVP
ncbi:DUF3375 family protein [Myceligenerans crystallogenes]|uniref:DUF3375 domain-containing protein n=1 Tax=Myceligenerans crystallogenes TaxID=316335 RepID=A0ABP4ZXK6_9MICO